MTEPVPVGRLVKPMEVLRVRKQCRECGREWEGNTFIPMSPEERARGYVRWFCDTCINREETARRDAERAARDLRWGPTVTELQPPRNAGDSWEPA